jgi:hypothetical protein
MLNVLRSQTQRAYILTRFGLVHVASSSSTFMKDDNVKAIIAKALAQARR